MNNTSNLKVDVLQEEKITLGHTAVRQSEATQSTRSAKQDSPVLSIIHLHFLKFFLLHILCVCL